MVAMIAQIAQGDKFQASQSSPDDHEMSL